MKLTKSLLLASAAGLVAVSGASAADLGIKKPSAVEYVKTCPTYGAGFFVVPGTTSCLKIIGRVRADYVSINDARATRGLGFAAVSAASARTKDKNVFRARAYLGYDHRTATEYGLLRTYVRLIATRDNNAAATTNLAGNTSRFEPVTVEYAFIQFGGLTVGRVTPVFEHGFSAHLFSTLNSSPAGSGTTGAIGGESGIVYVNSIGYTANFGGGFSATIALDSAKERVVGYGFGSALTAVGGQAAPDVVAALAYDAAWGSVKLSGAAHQNRLAAPGWAMTSKWGYAGALAAKVNLPFLAKGSNIWGSVSIAEGASSYTGYSLAAQQVGNVNFQASDAISLAPGRMTLTKTFGATGGITAYVTPTVYVAVAGFYGSHDAAGARNTVKTAGVIGNVGWTPVAGFLIGGEVAYRSISAPASSYFVGATATGKSTSDVTGRVRFQRDF